MGQATPSAARWRVVVAFGVFGLCWGAWGAALPAVRDRAGAGDAQVGLALVLLASAAIPAMAVAGRLVDRVGPRVAAPAAVAFAAAWCVALPARSPALLTVGLVLVGATSGLLDVVINAGAVAAERAGVARAVPTGHASFSIAALAGAVATGLARQAGASPPLLAGVLAVTLLAAALALRGLGGPAAAMAAAAAGAAPRPRLLAPLLVLGGLCAAGYALENADQTWGAALLEDERGAAPAVAGLAPGAFAGATAAARLVLSRSATAGGERRWVAGGAALAAGGLALQTAPGPVALALAGFALAGAGTGVIAPSLIAAAGRGVPPEREGRAVSLVAGVGYVGFVASPAAVGLVSGATSLTAALRGAAALAVATAVAAAVLLRPPPEGSATAGRRRRAGATLGTPRLR